MKNYLAKMVFQIICGEGHHTPQFDEQLRLLYANDVNDAVLKAERLGLASEEIFYNQQQQLVQWKFVDVYEIYEVSGADGAEICSHIVESDDAANYCKLIKDKARHLRRNQTPMLLRS